MRDLPSAIFNAAVEREFAFLLKSGFRITGRTDTSLTAGLDFVGRHVAIHLSLDRRDACIDCMVSRITDGKIVRNDVPGGYWGHLHAFLVKHRGYRGGFAEFRPCEESEDYIRELKMYAGAIKALAPDIATDSESVFSGAQLGVRAMLNIDELAAAIRSISPEEPAQRLGDLLIEWKRDDTTAEDLKSHIERAIGYIWFSTDAVHSEVYRLWSEFRSHAIDGIGGMTMNERLHWFGLFQRFDEAKTEEARKRIYAKLHAERSGR